MVTIDDARRYLEERLFAPALSSTALPVKVRGAVKNTWDRLQQFRKAGDLCVYLERFDGAAAPHIGQALHDAGLTSFEDQKQEFRRYLGSAALDVTTLNDFVIGAKYSTWDILIFSRVYDPRHGGIFLIPTEAPHEAIFIKATLSGGKYANSWLTPKSLLKYYFYSITKDFSPDYKYNKAIIDSGATPIYAFVRDQEGDDFVLEGIFRYVDSHQDDSGARWFELAKRDSSSLPVLVNESEYNSDLSAKVEKALQGSKADRRARLRAANNRPRAITVVTTNYSRNPDVIAEVLDRAMGLCEGCRNPAPFPRRSNGTPYLEVHHVIQLADGGDDTVDNAMALCPNCHRKRHYG